MTRNPLTLVALVLMAAGAIAAAAPSRATDENTLENRPAAGRNICDDPQIGETFGGDPKGCREYLDACLDELTSQQRTEWHRSVDECSADASTPFFRCYAQVPWC